MELRLGSKCWILAPFPPKWKSKLNQEGTVRKEIDIGKRTSINKNKTTTWSMANLFKVCGLELSVYRIIYSLIWRSSWRCGERGGGILHQIFGNRVQHAIKNWTKSDLRLCKNEGSKRSKINEKRVLIGSKITEKIYTNYLKTVK